MNLTIRYELACERRDILSSAVWHLVTGNVTWTPIIYVALYPSAPTKYKAQVGYIEGGVGVKALVILRNHDNATVDTLDASAVALWPWGVVRNIPGLAAFLRRNVTEYIEPAEATHSPAK